MLLAGTVSLEWLQGDHTFQHHWPMAGYRTGESIRWSNLGFRKGNVNFTLAVEHSTSSIPGGFMGTNQSTLFYQGV